jgi:capsular polysaccharide transport system permease protein
MIPFLLLGYNNLLLWRLSVSRALGAIDANRGLLNYRQIQIQDIFLVRMALEVMGITISYLFLWCIFGMMGFMRLPQNLSLVLIGWFFSCWFAASFGTFMGCLSEFSELVKRIWAPFGYIAFFFSGTYFKIDWLPKSLQKLILMFPLVHPVEMVRAGYWGDNQHWHYSMMYMTVICMAMMLLSGLLMRNRTLTNPHP